MIVKGEIKSRKAVILDTERIRELDSLICKYCNRIKYTAELKNGRQEIYSDVDALLASDNFGDEKVTNLDVWGWNNSGYNEISLSFGPKNEVFSHFLVVRGSYSFEEKDNADSFEKTFKLLLSKSTAPYWIAAKFNSNMVVLIGIIYCYLFLLNSIEAHKRIYITRTQMIVGLAGIMVFFLILKILDRIVHQSLLPQVAFVWGEEQKLAVKKDNIRSNLFWGVIVAIIIGLLISKIT